MKQKICTYLILLNTIFSFTCNLRAQNQIGIAGIVNFGNLQADGVSFNKKEGFGIGGILDIGLTKILNLRLEPMFLQKRAANVVTSHANIGIVKATFQGDYFEFPLFLKLDLLQNPKPYLLLGASFGLNLRAKLDFNQPGFTTETEIDAITKIFDFSVGAGGGLELPTAFGAILLEGHYFIGLVNIADKAPENLFTKLPEIGEKVKTRGLHLLTGIIFELD